MNDMTTGSPINKILRFSIPLIIGNIFQLFYSMVDTFIVGRTMGVAALAGIGASGSLTFLILGFAQGLTAGLSIPIAQAFGEKDKNKIERSVFLNWFITLIGAILLTALSLFILRPMLYIMSTPSDIIDYTYDYLWYIFTFMTVTLLYNMLSNMMRALGDSRTPLYFLIVAAITNIILDYVLIVYVNMGVAGAAVATNISQAVAVILCIIVIKRHWPMLKLRIHRDSIRKDELLYHIKVAVPMAFQASIIAIGAIAVAVALNKLGPTAVASYSAASKIEQIIIQILMSFGVAMATYVGQNYGARNFDRIRLGVRHMIFLSTSVAIVFGILLIIFGGNLVTLFAEGNEGQSMVEYGKIFFYCNSPFYLVLGWLFIYRYTLQGLGDTIVPTYAGISELIMRVAASFLLSAPFGFVGPAIASPLAWFGSVVFLMTAYYRRKNHLEDLHP